MKKIFNTLIMALVSLFAFTIVYAEGTVSIDASGKAILPSDVMGKTQNPVNIPSSLMPDTPTSINDYIVPCQYGNHILKVNTKDNTVIGVSATDYTMLSSYDVQIPASEIVKDGKIIGKGFNKVIKNNISLGENIGIFKNNLNKNPITNPPYTTLYSFNN